MKIQRVLMPTDFSSCAEAALDQTIFWARLFNAEVHLLHVIALYSASDPNAAFPELENLHNHLDRFATGELDKLKRKEQAHNLVLHTARRRAVSAAPEIVKYAEEEQIDLIVLGTHGRRGLRHFMMGSVAEEIIRTSGCPVLTVRGSRAEKVEPIHRILVPFDFSDEAKASLKEAEELATTHGARLDLLHVLAPPIAPGAFAGVPMPAVPNDELIKMMAENLAKVAEDSPRKELIETHVVEGSPSWAICDFAQKTKCDLIVQASHGLSGLTRLLLGSVSEKVARLAECPVLILRKPAPADA